MPTRSLCIAGLWLLAGVAPAAAQDSTAAPPPSTKVTLDLGLQNSAGNTRVTSFNMGDNVTFKAGAWALAQSASAVYARNGDSTTAEQVRIGGRVDHDLLWVLHVYVGANYERNRFAGIARRFDENAGLAFVIVDRPADQLTAETGSAINQQTSTLAVSETYASLRVAASYRHNFTNAAYVAQAAEVLPNLSNATDLLVNTESVLAAPLSASVAIKVSYRVKFDNLPEPGFQKSDRVLSSGVQIAF